MKGSVGCFDLPEAAVARDQALKGLREVNRLLVLAEEIARVGHWRIDLHRGLRVWSAGLYRIHGLADGAPLPPFDEEMSWYQEADRVRVRDTLATAASSPGPFTFEARIIRPDGTVRDVAVRGTSERDAAGSTSALFGVMMDVTAVKAANEALRLREHQLGCVIDSMPVLIGHWGRDLRNKLANGAYEAWFGKKPEDIFGKHLEEVIGSEMAELNRPYVEAVLRGEPQHFKRRSPMPGGGERLTLVTYQPDVLADVVEGFFVMATDITERKLDEDRLKAREAFLAKVGRVAKIGGWEIDLPSGNVRWSREMRKVHEVDDDFEPTLDDAVGAYDGPARQLVAEARRMAVEANRPWDLELPLLTAAGRSIWMRSAGEVELKDGVAVRMFGFSQDITAWKRASHDRETGLILLAEARELAEEACWNAEAADRAKTDFLADVSHELRTPIASILGYADRLSGSRTLAAGGRRHLDVIRSSAQAALAIVDDLLDIKRIEAGQLQLRVERFSLRDFLDEMVSRVEALATSKGIALRLWSASNVPEHVIGDAGRLRQVLLNLLGNSVKFTFVGRVALVVDMENAAPGDDRVRFSVRDTGIGIAADRVSLLFKRFSRVADPDFSSIGGTGLGLAISKDFVELMGGEIGVRSEKGEGSSFSFSIPLPRSTPMPDIRTLPAAAWPGGVGGVPAVASILVVEDVEANRELMGWALAAAGHRIDLASNGNEACRLCEARLYDLILMDIQMPEMGGIEATMVIRSADGLSTSTPIFALTASAGPLDVAAIERSGMNGLLLKPVDTRDLLRVVARAMATTRPRQSPIEAGARETVDSKVVVDLRSCLGHARFEQLIAQFADLLRTGITRDPPPGMRETCACHIEDIATSGGALGFGDLADVCRTLARQWHGRAQAPDAEASFVRARCDALIAIDRMLEGAGTGCVDGLRFDPGDTGGAGSRDGVQVPRPNGRFATSDHSLG